MKRATYLIVSQVYVPDPASVGQHMHDAARELAARGWRVVVYASARGYDDPSRRYPGRELRDGVEIRRLPFSSFGKGSLRSRLAGGMVFLAQASLRALFLRRLTGVMISTSPPMASAAGLAISLLRRVPLAFWVMDLNPDQAVVTAGIAEGSLPARALEATNRAAARRARTIVLLDRFMERRLAGRWPLAGKTAVLPPWPHDDHLEAVPHAENPFRREQGWEGERVFMYSGNISPVHPVAPILEAARALEADGHHEAAGAAGGEPGRAPLRFVFVGGGAGREAIEAYVGEHRLRTVSTLPYQPLDRLRYSLSAADVHMVTMGDAMVGIVHPCKIYGALRVERPVLFVGPAESHVGEILTGSEAGWQVEQEDVEGLVGTIRAIAALPEAELARRGRAGAEAIAGRYSKEHLCGAFVDRLEEGAGARGQKST